MVDFKYTKPNGVAPVGTITKINIKLAELYQRIGVGFIIEEAKKTKKKTK